MKPPLRLRDDPNAPPELRSDLERSASSLSSYDVVGGLAAFHAALGASQAAASLGAAATPAATSTTLSAGSAGASATAASAAGAGAAGVGKAVLTAAAAGGAAVKAGLIGAVLVGATVAVWPTSKAPTASEREQARSRASQHSPRLPSVSPAPPVSTPVPERAPEAVRPLTPAAPRPSPGPSLDVTWRREIALLGRIKSLVDADPARAYALTQQGRSQFRRGVLREEREALAVIALWNMGEQTRAERAAEQFLERYPRSSFRERLEALAGEAR